MDNIKMFIDMFRMQHIANETFGGKNYLSGINKFGLPVRFDRATRMEAFELLDSFDWKFWKGKGSFEFDEQNAKIEIVDMWHFIMSQLLMIDKDIREEYISSFIFADIDISEKSYVSLDEFSAECLRYVESQYTEKMKNENFYEFIEDFISLTFDFKENFTTILVGFFLMVKHTMEIKEFYELYLSKNALNLFRISHGYKDGSYVKIWNGKEDNVYLTEIIENNRDNLSLQLVLEKLEDIYKEI